MAERYFTVADVEALIPDLSRIMKPVVSAHAEVSAMQERMQAEQQRIAMAGGGVLDRRAWRADKDKIERLTGEIRRGLAEIVELGGAPKDLGLGLVDFPHLRDGREVLLCWELSEERVAYWHDLEGTYDTRRPIE